MLNSANISEVNGILQLFIKCLSRMNKSANTKSPEILASLGIYLSIILRHDPDLNLYVDGEHFLLTGLKCYLPYMNMYITFFLMATIIKHVNLEVPCIQPENYIYNNRRINSPPKLMKKNSPSSNSTTPDNSPIVPGESDLLRSEVNKLRHTVGAQVDYNSLVNTIHSYPPTQQNQSQQDSTRQLSPERLGRTQSIRSESIIDKLISICSVTSPERRVLFELKRIYASPATFFLAKLGLKEQKQELALFLDMPELLNNPLGEEDIQKAIFMHSNKVLNTVTIFRPHHFNRSIECLNYSMAKKTSHMSDWVLNKTLDDFTYICKELKHAICLELLLLVVKKNIILCSHHIKRIPESWRERVLKVYTTPRWKSALQDFQCYLSQETAKVQNTDDDMVDIKKGLCNGNIPVIATFEYYRLNLCLGEDYGLLIHYLEKLEERLKDPHAFASFIETTKTMNKSYYLLQVSNYIDVFAKNKVVFANAEDLVGQDIFELSRNFVVPCRESPKHTQPNIVVQRNMDQREHGDKIFLLDFSSFKNLVESRINPYNRNALSETVFEEIMSMFQFYNTLGLSNECITISEFAKELLKGRDVATPCHCRKDYMTKLIRVLRHYNVKEESFEYIILKDICFKFSLMSMEFQAKDIPELCMKLYTGIKKAKDSESEKLKRIIASAILIYSKYQGSAFIVNM